MLLVNLRLGHDLLICRRIAEFRCVSVQRAPHRRDGRACSPFLTVAWVNLADYTVA